MAHTFPASLHIAALGHTGSGRRRERRAAHLHMCICGMTLFAEAPPPPSPFQVRGLSEANYTYTAGQKQKHGLQDAFGGAERRSDSRFARCTSYV